MKRALALAALCLAAASTAAVSDDSFLAVLDADRRPLVVQALPPSPASLRTTLDASLITPRATCSWKR